MLNADKLFFTYPKASSPALKGISFSVGEGEIFGFLGPSGAGKSTAVKVLTGLLGKYTGKVTVMGSEVRSAGTSFYNSIGVAFEFPNLYTRFSGLENLQLAARLYPKPTEDPVTLLRRLELHRFADQRVSSYSKGMRMRLSLCRALIGSPSLLFLDEPTSGLDPVYAGLVKRIIRERSEDGTTVVLTTHNMQVADELCHRVGFIVDGEMPVCDTPKKLKLAHSRETVQVEYRSGGSLVSEELPLNGLHANRRFRELSSSDALVTIHSCEATLDEVFSRVTGRSLA